MNLRTQNTKMKSNSIFFNDY